MPRHTSQIKRIKQYFHTMLVLHVILAYVYNVYVCTTIKPVLKGYKLRTIPVKLTMWYGIIFIIHISIYCKRLRFRNVTALLVIFNPPPRPISLFFWNYPLLKPQRLARRRFEITAIQFDSQYADPIPWTESILNLGNWLREIHLL